jgi:hypothetical protein
MKMILLVMNVIRWGQVDLGRLDAGRIGYCRSRQLFSRVIESAGGLPPYLSYPTAETLLDYLQHT